MCFCRHLSLNMQTEEARINSLHQAEKSTASRPVVEKETDFSNDHTLTSSSDQEYRYNIPNVFRGINTSGSYHVYGDLHFPAGKLEGSIKISALPRGGEMSQKRCLQGSNTNVAHSESSAIVSHARPFHPSFPSTVIQPAGVHRSHHGPAAPMEEEGIQHPQTSCLRLSPGFSKGVICSPQSPLRSDCQPNSPTESSSSRNAILSFKQPSDCPKDAKARNWKKYKFILMNQTPDENEKEAQRCKADDMGMSPTRSPCRSGGAGEHSDVQSDEGASESREESPMSQSADSCSSSTCSSIR